ncbi:MAG: hypothetical protein JWO78_50 [Micavibrio sp.]|nr:hypothetical protein [Micavibrio sp.]
MGEIIGINEFRKSREQKSVPSRGNANSSPAFARASQRPASTSLIQTAIREKNITVLSLIRVPCLHPDIRTYKRNSVDYQLLLAVFEDDLDKAKSLLNTNGKNIDIKAKTYWHYPTRTDVHFLTPGHLIKSSKMAQLIKSHGGDITPFLRVCFPPEKLTPA